MRIAILIPIIGDAYGQEKVLKDACESLHQLGHQVFIISEEQVGALPRAVRCDIVDPLTGFSIFSDAKVVESSHARVLELLSEIRPDVVHFYDQFDHRLMRSVIDRYPTAFTAHTVAPTCPASTRSVTGAASCTKRSGYPCVLHHHGYGCLGFLRTDLHRVHAVYEYRLRRKQLERIGSVIAISDYVKHTLLSDGFNAERVRRLYNPVRTHESAHAVTATPDHLVCAARLVPLKGVDHVIQALARMKHSRAVLTIAGEGEQEPALRALTESLRLTDRVRFLGKLSYADTQKVLASGVVVVQPNLGPEGFGLTLAEASALGRPVIAYQVPAFDEVIENGRTGLLVPRGDIDGLAAAFDRLITDPRSAGEMGKRAKERMASLFSPESHVQGLVEIYETLSGAREPALREQNAKWAV